MDNKDSWNGAEWAEAECRRTRVSSGEYEGLTAMLDSTRDATQDTAYGTAVGLLCIGKVVIRTLEEELTETVNIRWRDYFSQMVRRTGEEYQAGLNYARRVREWECTATSGEGNAVLSLTVSDKLKATGTAAEYALTSIVWTVGVKSVTRVLNAAEFCDGIISDARYSISDAFRGLSDSFSQSVNDYVRDRKGNVLLYQENSGEQNDKRSML